jgi:hypothetical protein
LIAHLLSLSLLLISTPERTASGEPVRIHRSDESRLTFTYTLTEIDTQTVGADGEDFLQVRGPHPLNRKSGEPDLPYWTVRFALPPGATPEVTVRPLSERVLPDVPRVLPVPHSEDEGLTFVYRPDPRVYGGSGMIPGNRYELRGPFLLRNQRYAELRLHPFRYVPRENRLTLATSFQVDVVFRGGSGAGTVVPDDPFDGVYRGNFVNYGESRAWRESPGSSIQLLQDDPFEGASAWVKIVFTEEGLYQVTYEDLSALGIVSPPTGLESAYLKMLSYGGNQLPNTVDSAFTPIRETGFWLDDGSDGSLDAGDRIVFYGLSMKRFRFEGDSFRYFEHDYSDTNVVWLGIGHPEGGTTVETRTRLIPGGIPVVEECDGFYRHEVNLINTGRAGTRWEGEQILRDGGQSMEDTTFGFSLADLNSPFGTVEVNVVGGKSGTNRVLKFLLNDVLFDTLYGRGIVEIDGTFDVTNLEGSSDLEIELHADVVSENDWVYLDYFEVHYRRELSYGSGTERFDFQDATGALSELIFEGSVPSYLWDVSNPFHPVSIGGVETQSGGFHFADSVFTGKSYLLASGTKAPVRMELRTLPRLRNPSLGADYIALAPREFLSALGPLISWREDRLAMPEDTLWVREGGRVMRVAWEDVIDEFGYGVPDPVAIRNFVKYAYDRWTAPQPTYLALFGEGSYDYKNFQGEGRNLLPPYEPWEELDVNSVTTGPWDDFYADMDGDEYPDLFLGRVPVFSKVELEQYVEKALRYEQGLANGMWRNSVVLVADDEYGSGTSETEHTRYADELYREYVPRSMAVRNVYLVEYPEDERGPRSKAAFTEAFSDGALFLIIFAHGNPTQLTHERMFEAPLDFTLVDAGPRNPVVMISACKVGNFDRVALARVIAEDWCLREGGAVNVLSSTTLCGHQIHYFRQVMTLAMDGRVHPMGELMLQDKSKFMIHLGEPAIPIEKPPVHFSVGLEDTADNVLIGRFNPYTGEDAEPDDRMSVQAFTLRKGVTYVNPSSGVTINYMKPPSAYFKGSTRSDAEGDFDGSFFVPSGIEAGDTASLLVYAPSGLSGTVGFRDTLHLVQSTPGGMDLTGPEIHVSAEGREIADGDTVTVPETFELFVECSDESGVCILDSVPLQGEPGISLIINGDRANAHNLARDFEYYEGDSTSGFVLERLTFSGGGANEVGIEAYDNLASLNPDDHRSVFEATFLVEGEEDLEILDPLAYPNPLRDGDGTRFTFLLENERARYSVKLYTIAGRLIWVHHESAFGTGFQSVSWDGRDADGDQPANGLYFFKVEAETREGTEDSAIGKLLIAR